ncbi:uncharacterized protein LOC144713516 [Wolffia australiana]
MKKYADQHGGDVEFQVGDLVLLKTNAQMLMMKQAKQHPKGLVPRYDGTFEVVAKIRRVAYRLNIPHRLAVHLVFHVSETEAVLAKREIDWGRHGCYHKIEYLIKWKNMPMESATWERDSDLWQFQDLLWAYEA